MTPKVLDYIAGDATPLELAPMERLAAEGQLAVYKHEGFWACMDTPRDMQWLNEQWTNGTAPWQHAPRARRRAA